jgi:uncharacterized membrane protein
MSKKKKNEKIDNPEDELEPQEETLTDDDELENLSDEELMDEPSDELPDDEEIIEDDDVPDDEEIIDKEEGDEEDSEEPEEEADDTGDEDTEEEEEEPGIFGELYNNIFSSSWEMWIGSILLAVLSVFLFLLASPWGSSGGLLNIGQNLFDSLGVSLYQNLHQVALRI